MLNLQTVTRTIFSSTVSLLKWSLILYGTEYNSVESERKSKNTPTNFNDKNDLLEEAAKYDDDDQSVSINDIKMSPLDSMQNSTSTAGCSSLMETFMKSLIRWSMLGIVIILFAQ